MDRQTPDQASRARAGTAQPVRRALLSEVTAYQAPLPASAACQLAITVMAWIAVLVMMYAALRFSVLAAWGLAPVAGGLLVRIFIIQHDCGHGSYVRSRRVNDAIGWMCSLATLTPYGNWRVQHAHHHAAWNNLDRRGGRFDIYSSCLTVAEYRALPPLRRLAHRVMLHPLVAQVALPPVLVFVLYRFPFNTPSCSNRERASVHRTTLALAVLYTSLALLLGARAVFLVQVPVVVVASIVGVWLFAVQHRFEVGAVGAGCGVGSGHGRAARQFVSAFAWLAALVHRQHRVASSAPPGPAHPELSPAGMPAGLRGAGGQRGTGVVGRGGAAGWALRAVGREPGTHGPVRGSGSVIGFGG